MAKALEHLNEEEINNKSKVPEKATTNYPISKEIKKELNISEEIQTANELIYRKNPEDYSSPDYLLNLCER